MLCLYLLIVFVSLVFSEEIEVRKCSINNHPIAASAFNRAQSEACKSQIASLACKNNWSYKGDFKSKCPGHFNLTKPSGIYEKKSRFNVNLEFEELKKLKKIPRIVFLFSVNGRSIRQILRLLKAVYSEQHFYYFHIDERMLYLKEELKKITGIVNYHVADWSLETMWGGASLLQMHLRVFTDLERFKKNGLWDWDFVLNLSESDYPIKSVQELTVYLAKYRDNNFLKYRSSSIEKWFNSSGIKKAFFQCENHMWKMSDRELPTGLLIDGGSDWFCLNHKFIEYILTSTDSYLNTLKEFYNYTLLPSESFFHSVIMNSPFCHTLLNGNLRFTNWKRERGCQCQYQHIVDWCGCSPNILTYDEWSIIKNHHNKPIFFARKFDPLFNSQLINNVDQSIFGLYTTDFLSVNSFWINIYDQIDKNPTIDYEIIFSYFTIASTKYITNLIESFEVVGPKKILNQIEFNKVNSFFQSDKFKGLVININNELNYEAYFIPVKSKFLTKINKESNLGNSFLNSLIHMEISTNYDFKEQKLTNYAAFIKLNSNPVLLMQIDPLQNDMNLIINWINPHNKSMKETKALLKSSETTQLLVNGFFGLPKVDLNNRSLNESGIWKIQLSLANEGLILTKEFLVLHSSNPFEDKNTPWYNIISKFWHLDSICFLNSNKLNGFVKGCKSTFWSSEYPDPKSKFNMNNLGTNRLNRI